MIPNCIINETTVGDAIDYATLANCKSTSEQSCGFCSLVVAFLFG